MRNSLGVPHSTERCKVTNNFVNMQAYGLISSIFIEIFILSGLSATSQRHIAFSPRRAAKLPRRSDTALTS